MSRISLLDPLLSSRIAAGEVIERPQSVLRELLDNAIDAGADEIRVSIEGGGIDLLSVADNGSGIRRDDLNLLGTRHATSKLHKPDDLYAISTLGFRGEALYSISAVSRMTISTKCKETGEASTLVIDNAKREDIMATGPDIGTIVTVENLFREIPARRAFLKRNSTEAQMCRSILTSKALSFPNIRFILTIDGAIRLDWSRVDNLKERVMYLLRQDGISDADVNHLKYESEDFTLQIVAGNSSVKRSDRREIRIYVNNRPVEEYSLVQAVTYGYGELLPGGSYPYAAVFINDKPELVDFNIHPAKKEVKLRNKAEIHHAISTLLKGIERKIPEIKHVEYYLDSAERWEDGSKTQSFIKKEYAAPAETSTFTDDSYSQTSERIRSYKEKDSAWLEKAKSLGEAHKRAKQAEPLRKEEKATYEDDIEFRYIGQAFNLFLIAERDGALYLIDQHAAHERIIYDELLEQKTVQNLLIPIKIEVDALTDEFLSAHCYVYTKLGIMLSRSDDGIWEIIALPAVARPIETQIVEYITSAKADEHELEMNLFSIIACKAAIKAGDVVDKWSAEALLRKVFALKEPCCPHGRTFLVKLKEKELRLMVGRTS